MQTLQAPPDLSRGMEERYDLLGRAGQGAFAIVYRARQRSTGQIVALKVLRRQRELDGEDGQEVVSRFQREMRLLGQLRHPSIVRLIDAGTLDDGRMFIACEYLEGSTLHALIDTEGPLPLAELRHLMLQLLDALCAAHDLGLVHRDVKPQNIMVSPGGVRRNATLLDFGVATATEGHRLEGFEAITRSGTVLGTPAYLAPELVLGEPSSPASDLFGWGLVFLEAFTGRPVLGGRTFSETISSLMGAAPIPIPPELVGTELGALLQQVLEKRLDRRASSAREAFLALERCPVELRPSVTVPVPPPSVASDTAPLTRLEGAAWTLALVVTFEPELDDDEPDPAHLAALVSDAAHLVEREGGPVIVPGPDGVEVVFGPTPDAEEVVRSGLRLASQLRELGRTAAGGAGSGSGYVARCALHGASDLPLESVLSTTRRLAALARPDAVLLSGPVLARVAPGLRVEPIGMRQLPGEATPHTLYALRG